MRFQDTNAEVFISLYKRAQCQCQITFAYQAPHSLPRTGQRPLSNTFSDDTEPSIKEEDMAKVLLLTYKRVVDSVWLFSFKISASPTILKSGNVVYFCRNVESHRRLTATWTKLQ